MSQAKRRPKGGRSYDTGMYGQFMSVPVQMLRAPTFKALSPRAKVVLLALMSQWQGTNNGALSCTAENVGMARGTFYAALAELQEAKLIVRTRDSVRMSGHGKAAGYALGWLYVDDCPGVGPEFVGKCFLRLKEA